MNVYVREYQKIESRTRRRDNFLLRYLPILLFVAVALVLGKIYIQSATLSWSDRLVDLKSEVRDLELENEELAREIGGLQTRDRVVTDAGNRLGMTVSEEADVVYLRVLDRSIGAGAERPVADGSARGSRASLAAWFNGLWQEEALALTSQ